MDSQNLTQPRTADTPSLFASRGSRARRPRVEALVAPLLTSLARRSGWVSAATLASDLGCDDRTVRAAASKSAGQVIGGQLGYCLTTRASLAEVQVVTRALLSQSARMKQRVLEIERVRHRMGDAR